MAITPIDYPSPLRHFAQSSLTVVSTGLHANPIGFSDPFQHFDQTSLTPIAGGTHYKPFPPLPDTGGGGGGGSFGVPT